MPQTPLSQTAADYTEWFAAEGLTDATGALTPQLLFMAEANEEPLLGVQIPDNVLGKAYSLKLDVADGVADDDLSQIQLKRFVLAPTGGSATSGDWPLQVLPITTDVGSAGGELITKVRSRVPSAPELAEPLPAADDAPPAVTIAQRLPFAGEDQPYAARVVVWATAGVDEQSILDNLVVRGPGDEDVARSLIITGSARRKVVQVRLTPAAGETGTYTIHLKDDGVKTLADVGTGALDLNTFYVPPLVPTLSAEFAGLSALPVGWTQSANAVVTFPAEGLRAVSTSGAGGWGDKHVASPVFVPEDLMSVSIDFSAAGTFALGLSEPGLWGDFSQQSSLVISSANIHNGKKAIQASGFVNNISYRLQYQFHSGRRAVNMRLSSRVGDVLTEELNINFGLIDAIADGTNLYFDTFNGSINLESVRVTSGLDTYKTSAVVRERFYRANANLIAFDNVETVPKTLIQQRMVEAGVLGARVVGGDLSSYFDWDAFGPNIGGIIGDPAPNIDGNGRRNSPGFNRTPDELPLGLQYQLTKRFPMASVAELFSGVPLTWVINVTTSGGVWPDGEPGLQKELRHAAAAIALGMNIAEFELGNEHYFAIDNYRYSSVTGEIGPNILTQDPGESAGDFFFRQMEVDLDHYMVRASRWCRAFSARFSDTPIYITGDSTTAGHGPRSENWNKAINKFNLWRYVKGITIHPYYKISDTGIDFALADVGDDARAAEITAGCFARFREVMGGASDYLPEGKEILITEINVLEDPSQTPVGGFCQSWAHALILDAQNHYMISDPRIAGVYQHMLLGNAQWSLIYNERGTAPDPTKRGVDNFPYADNVATPYSLSMSGFVYGLSSSVFNGGQGALLSPESGDPYFAWHIGNKISAVNATGAAQTFTAPAGGSWSVTTYAYSPWEDAVSPESLAAPVVSSVAGGVEVPVPAFAKILATRV